MEIMNLKSILKKTLSIIERKNNNYKMKYFNSLYIKYLKTSKKVL
jgi:hypothetical protein